MSYWSNTYMPTIDSLALRAAIDFTNQVGKDLNGKWVDVDGDVRTTEDAKQYLVECLVRAEEDYAMNPEGYYAHHVFGALADGIESLIESDWA